MRQAEYRNDGFCKEASDEIKTFISQYIKQNELNPEQLSVILGCSVRIVYAILNGTCIFSLAATNYIENHLNIDLSNPKSHLGSSPTLFNSSSTSGFVYHVVGCDEDGMHHLNAKDSLIDIISGIRENYSLEYAGCRNEIFEQNINMVDSRMDEILQYAMLLRVGYLPNESSTTVVSTCQLLAEKNPLNVRNPHAFYTSKLKSFLFASFAGMTASEEWNGRKLLTGGYIDVDKDGEMLYYRAMSDDVFENSC